MFYLKMQKLLPVTCENSGEFVSQQDFHSAKVTLFFCH